jgi:hypothetical protein
VRRKRDKARTFRESLEDEIKRLTIEAESQTFVIRQQIRACQRTGVYDHKSIQNSERIIIQNTSRCDWLVRMLDDRRNLSDATLLIRYMQGEPKGK